MTPRLTNRLNLSFIVDDCAGVGEGKEGRKRREMRRLYVKRAGQREGGGSLSPGSTVVVENQLKTEARRVLPSDAFVSVSIALATHSDGALCGHVVVKRTF